MVSLYSFIFFCFLSIKYFIIIVFFNRHFISTFFAEILIPTARISCKNGFIIYILCKSFSFLAFASLLSLLIGSLLHNTLLAFLFFLSIKKLLSTNEKVVERSNFLLLEYLINLLLFTKHLWNEREWKNGINEIMLVTLRKGELESQERRKEFYMGNFHWVKHFPLKQISF